MRAEIRAAERAVEAARGSYTQARARANRPLDAAEVARPLTSYHRDVLFRQRNPDPQVEARLNRELLEEIMGRGLILKPRDMVHPAAGFEIHDPSLAPAEDAAEAELRAAEDELRRVKAEHAEAIEQAEAAEAVREFRESLTSSDPVVVAAAFDRVRRYEKPHEPPPALRTDDLGAAVR
jgi:hypothetical protein